MAAKSASNRRTTASKNSTTRVAPRHDEDDDALEDALAYEHGFSANDDDDDDDDEEGTGYVTRATEKVRHMTRGREGRVVVGALVGGFAIGAAIGCIIAISRNRPTSWTDRLGNALPESIREKLHC
jgi:hypothetical protein